MPGKTDDNPKSATRYQMVTESANKPSLSMAAKVKNLQNNSKFHQSVSMSFLSAFTELILPPLTSIHALHCVTQKGRKPNQKQTKKRNT